MQDIYAEKKKEEEKVKRMQLENDKLRKEKENLEKMSQKPSEEILKQQI